LPKQSKDLEQFLKPFSDDTRKLVMWLREFAWQQCPQANELIYDNYNAVAVGWSPTESVVHTACSIAVGCSSHNVHFGFYWGNELPDPKKILLGKGNQYRYILVTDKKNFPQAYIKKLVAEALAISLAKVKDPAQIVQGRTIVKSVSEKKRAPGKAKQKAAKSARKPRR
jgi:hypothetical protein